MRIAIWNSPIYGEKSEGVVDLLDLQMRYPESVMRRQRLIGWRLPVIGRAVWSMTVS